MTPRSNRPSGTLYRPSWGLFMAKSQIASRYTLICMYAPGEPGLPAPTPPRWDNRPPGVPASRLPFDGKTAIRPRLCPRNPQNANRPGGILCRNG